jgi:diguanylate cyclase (GGDEF)-like protein
MVTKVMFSNVKSSDIRHEALRIALVYAAIAVLYMFYSDQLFFHCVDNFKMIMRLLTLKCWIFIFATSLLIYFLIYNEIAKLRRSEEELRKHRYHLEELVAERTFEQTRANGQLRQEIVERKRAEEALQNLAITDTLTDCFNRRHFFSVAENELARAARYKRHLSAIMLDIDRFKRVNDTYGHLVGDEVLVAIAGRISKVPRKTDIFARYGGEEFVILLPETDISEAQQTAERIRKEIADRPIRINGRDISVSASLGVASKSSEENITIDLLLDRADQALYAAKRAGRNRVMVCAVSGEGSDPAAIGE